MISISYPPISAGGGGGGTLQTVTDAGNTTTNDMIVKPLTGETKVNMFANTSFSEVNVTESTFNSIAGLGASAPGVTAGSFLFFYDDLNGSILKVTSNRPNILTDTLVVFDYDAGVVVIKHIGKTVLPVNGTTIYIIPHGLPFEPQVAIVNAQSANAAGDFFVTVGVVDITVTYLIPPVGANLSFYWQAIK